LFRRNALWQDGRAHLLYYSEYDLAVTF